MIGKTLGHYQVTSQLGKGGMGEVYRARDTKLNRDVALKVLPPEFSNDAERMARFKREAQTLASLNHTSIAAIYGLEESGDVRALIMELAEGPTLADRISKGPIPLDEALSIARQIAEALEAAHEKGIIHRDLKPANIKVASEGTVKVLDFGLAKALEGETAIASASESPTLSLAATKAGVILGTAAYMAPEQARGAAVDKRCDIWSFGVVLFEMLTGKQLFAGETISDTLAAVLRSDIDLNLLPGDTPLAIRTLLRRCLTKDRKERLRDIGEARITIADYRANPVNASAQGRVTKKKLKIAWTLAAVCLVCSLVLGIVAVVNYSKTPAQAPDLSMHVNTPPTWDPVSFAISPDGRNLVFSASSQEKEELWLRPLDQVAARPLDGTEDARYPFWSPDSRSVAFFAGGKLKRVDIAGGPPQKLADAANAVGGAWSDDGTIVFGPSWSEALYRVPASGGGEPVAVTRLDPPRHLAHVFPKFLPDNRHFLFFAWGTNPGVYLGTIDSAETRRLTAADTAAVYAPPGYLLFMRQGTLLAQRFEAKSGELSGKPVQIADSVDFYDLNLFGAFSASETGILAYRTAASTRRRLAWFNRTGKEIRALRIPEENNMSNPELSPDGRKVGVDCSVQGKNFIVQGNLDVYLIDAERGEAERFTFDAEQDRFPIWSPDGSRIIFSSGRKNKIMNIYQKSSSGAADDELLWESFLSKWATDVSPDRRFLLFTEFGKTGADVWALPLSGERKPVPIVKSGAAERNGKFSPDGRWVAYESNESGRYEVYVQSFPGSGGKWQVSSGGGTGPRWRHDGRELFYITRDGILMAVQIDTTSQVPKKGAAEPLFQTRMAGMVQNTAKQQYSVAPDGQRFLLNITAGNSTQPITVVTNWNRALTK
jgi:serine/threonine protein kinase